MKYTKVYKQRYRSVFLSDFHMGAKSFDAKALLSFLKSMECDYLFLVGDIIDGWKLQKRMFWPDIYNDVLDELFAKIETGTKVIYLPGNHDDEIRDIHPAKLKRFSKSLGFRTKNKVIHKLADGRRIVVLHGDQFDRKIIKGSLSRWSDALYNYVAERFFHDRLAKITINGEVKPFSLAKALAHHGSWALQMINNFENAVLGCIQRHNADGLICGHTHIPAIKNIKGTIYANCGSWLRNGHTALVEDYEGKLSLMDWPFSGAGACDQTFILHAMFGEQGKQKKVYSAKTEALSHMIHRLWSKDAVKSAQKARQNVFKPIKTALQESIFEESVYKTV